MSNKQSEKLSAFSPEFIKELIDQLKKSMPQIFDDGEIDFKKLQSILGDIVENMPERYGFTWKGKKEAFRNAQSLSLGTLRPQFEESVNWENSQNLIIEGENLEVLKLLQKSYYGKVKVIYIDPPYNTENDLVYSQGGGEGLDEYLRYKKQQRVVNKPNLKDKMANGLHHSTWLTMMYPRLFLARNLLSEDGMIFISIDDNEVHNLRLIMNEIFGDENFVGTFIWHRRQKNNNPNRSRVSIDHEYLLLYKKSKGVLKGENIDFDRYSNPDNDPRGPWMASDLTVIANRERRPHLFYNVINPETGIVYQPSPGRGWSVSQYIFQDLVDRNRIIWPKNSNGRPRLKKFLKEIQNVDKDFSTMLKVGFNTEGIKEIQDLFNERIFPFAKPTNLIKTLIQQATEKEGLILDFFAGSGTTAQAVLEANEEDGGTRKFILVQLPERTDLPNFPTVVHITRERVRRVIKNISNNSTTDINFEEVRSNSLGFRSFTLDSSNFKKWQYHRLTMPLVEQLAMYVDNLLPGRTDNDRLYELILNEGLPLSVEADLLLPAENLTYSILKGNLIICLSKSITWELLQDLFNSDQKKNRPIPDKVICLDLGFQGNDSLKTNAKLQAQALGISLQTI